MNKKYTVLIKRIDTDEVQESKQVISKQLAFSVENRMLAAYDDNIYYSDIVDGWK